MSLCAAAIVGASFHAIPEPLSFHRDQQWRELGVDPAEAKKVDHMSRQLSSDYQFHRPLNMDDYNYVIGVVDRGGPLASEVYWNLLPFRDKELTPKLMDAAAKSAKSNDESEAFAAIEALKAHGDRRWKPIALSHSDDPRELMQLVYNEANN